jgi:hypothetical protein
LPEILQQGLTDIRHGGGDSCGSHFILNRGSRSTRALGIGLDIQFRIQGVHPALEGGQFALRIRGHHQHVSRFVVEIAHPARHDLQPRRHSSSVPMVTGKDLIVVVAGTIGMWPHDQRVRRVKTVHR